MIRYLYEWMQNLACYMILITAADHIMPEHSYKKYIRFFAGLVMVTMLAAPLLSVFEIQGEFARAYAEEEKRQEERLNEKLKEYLEKAETFAGTETKR